MLLDFEVQSLGFGFNGQDKMDHLAVIGSKDTAYLATNEVLKCANPLLIKHLRKE